MIGKTLSHYEIISLLGKGGMGEVYQAKDTKLGRDVAIKTLPEEFARDADRVARFQREAKLLASLNHPNIAAIYGLEEAGGKQFLVLELVEGETLASRLKRGLIPVEETIKLVMQIAEALEAAHEKGVIHRDLKPGNIKVTPDGNVKVLDFGLAKAYANDQDKANPQDSPTISDAATRQGVILGTAAYMSPEQARGKAIDKRADIWAFGCVLYEMLTGKRPFQGDTVTETLASILKGEPDWNALPVETPWIFRILLRQCLQKELKRRLHEIADVRIEMADIGTQPIESAPIQRRRSRLWQVAGALVMLAVGSIASIALIKHFQTPPSAPTVKATIKVEPGYRLGGEDYWKPTKTSMVVAHKGSFVVYAATRENDGPQAKQQIYLRRMDQMNAIPVAGTEGGATPFLSPDDKWIGFHDGEKLMKVPVTGGIPTVLCNIAYFGGADWGSDNYIIYFTTTREGLCRISSEGGQPEVLTTPDVAREEISHRLPHTLPEGRGVIFTIMGNTWDLHPRLALLDLKTRKWRELMKDAADGRYLPSGHLVFLRHGTLMAVAFDLDRLEINDQPVPIVSDVMQTLNFSGRNNSAGQYSISDSGDLVYVPGGIGADREDSLVHVDLKGNIQPAVDFKAPFMAPRFSPDGRKIAYHTVGKQTQLWIYDRASASASPLVIGGNTFCSEWTPDGKNLVFNWTKVTAPRLYWQPVDRSSPMEQIDVGMSNLMTGSFSPDGTILAFVHSYKINDDILLLDMKSRKVTPFLNTETSENCPAISPDGHWMAYSSNESGRREIWVRPFPGEGGKWKVSGESGIEPIWSKDGKQLYYRDEGRVWAVDIHAGEGISAGKPRLLFQKDGFAQMVQYRNWDLWPDGQGFIMVKREEVKPQPVTEMILIQNWIEELKQKMPKE